MEIVIVKVAPDKYVSKGAVYDSLPDAIHDLTRLYQGQDLVFINRDGSIGECAFWATQ
jgi:hypothetical protein